MNPRIYTYDLFFGWIVTELIQWQKWIELKNEVFWPLFVSFIKIQIQNLMKLCLNFILLFSKIFYYSIENQEALLSRSVIVSGVIFTKSVQPIWINSNEMNQSLPTVGPSGPPPPPLLHRRTRTERSLRKLRNLSFSKQPQLP